MPISLLRLVSALALVVGGLAGMLVPVLLGAVLTVLAATQPTVAHLLAPGHASQELPAAGPLGVITTLGTVAYIVGSLLLGAALVRARRLPRAVGWVVALAWVLMPPSFVFPVLRAPGVALPYLALARCSPAAPRRRSVQGARLSSAGARPGRRG